MAKKKNVTVRRKRRKGAPEFVQKPRQRAKETPATAARRARILDICARTRAARAEIAAEMKGADLSDLKGLPVVIGAHKPPGMRRSGRAKEIEIDLEAGPVEPPARPPIPPPVDLGRARAVSDDPVINEIFGLEPPRRNRRFRGEPRFCTVCGSDNHLAGSPFCVAELAKFVETPPPEVEVVPEPAREDEVAAVVVPEPVEVPVAPIAPPAGPYRRRCNRCGEPGHRSDHPWHRAGNPGPPQIKPVRGRAQVRSIEDRDPGDEHVALPRGPRKRYSCTICHEVGHRADHPWHRAGNVTPPGVRLDTADRADPTPRVDYAAAL